MQKKYLSIFGIIIIIIFYSVFLSISDLDEFLKQMDSVKVELIPIILTLHFLVVILRIFRQKILFDSIKVELSLKEHFMIHLSGLALIMTPGGLGQSVKAVYLKEKKDISYGKSISLTLSERFYDLLSIIPVIFVMSFFVDSLNPVNSVPSLDPKSTIKSLFLREYVETKDVLISFKYSTSSFVTPVLYG